MVEWLAGYSRWTDQQMDGWMDRLRVDGSSVSWMDGWMGGFIGGLAVWLDGQMGGWMDGWKDGFIIGSWVDGWVNGWIYKLNGQMGRWMDWIDDWMVDGWMRKWMDWWMAGWLDWFTTTELQPWCHTAILYFLNITAVLLKIRSLKQIDSNSSSGCENAFYSRLFSPSNGWINVM